ncbi:tRNA (guanosine(37)-N1)-methyltransferase TrmD [Candidatus Parcubacteria bacterium]|nr:tRNA (guanosine(37)-N1)-methyltransferase TrmD [Candidatus Parcubacteria bacterium]
MNFHVITIFPEMFDSYLGDSILARAIAAKKISVKFYNPRDFAGNKHNTVDDRPYGGGPGMTMMAEPVARAIEKAKKGIERRKNSKIKIILFTPDGKKFDTDYAKKVVKGYTDIILVAGRYEGIDTRIRKMFRAEEISIGDYVLTGGELPAMILVDSISRQIPGVLGKFESLEEERISSGEIYTRPAEIVWKDKKYKVPKVLLSGDHKKIDEWRDARRKKK